MRNEIHDPFSELCDCPICERAMYEMLSEIMTVRARKMEQRRIAKIVAFCVFASLVLYSLALFV